MTDQTWWLLALLLTLACQTEAGQPVVRTLELRPPEDTASAYEPFAVIDPGRPDRLVVGAQYGPGYNRGGLRMWSWSSPDAGATWLGGRVVPKAFPAGQALGADLTMAVGTDGTVYHLSLTSDSGSQGLLSAAAALATSRDGGRSFQPTTVFGRVDQEAPNVLVFTDKPWIAMDRGATSRTRGTLYLSWSRNRVVFGPHDTTVSTSPVIASSPDGGRTISSPRALADSGFGVELAVRPDGALDAVWYESRDLPGVRDAGYRVLHAASRDGGLTFERPLQVTVVPDTSVALELPRLSLGRDGGSLVCWVQGGTGSTSPSEVWCSKSRDGSAWSVATPALAEPAVTFGYPALAATNDAFWLLAYAADSAGIHVRLYRSLLGDHFSQIAELASRALPRDRFCPRPMLPCRRSLEHFFPGDYITLAGSPRRLLAAYVLPRTPDSLSTTSVLVSVVDPR